MKPYDDLKQGSSQAGFSLLGVLLSIACLSFFISLYYQGQATFLRSRKIIDSSIAVHDVNEAFVGDITAIIREVSPAVNGCLDLSASVNERRFSKAFGTATLNYAPIVMHNQWLGASLSSELKETLLRQAQANSVTKNAAFRCRTPRLPRSTTQAQQNTFYFCATVKQDTFAQAGSFLSSPWIFTEIGWQLINLQTGAPISCQTFKQTQESAGAQVYYAIYWAVPLGQGFTFKKHVNSFMVGK